MKFRGEVEDGWLVAEVPGVDDGEYEVTLEPVKPFEFEGAVTEMHPSDRLPRPRFVVLAPEGMELRRGRYKVTLEPIG